MAIPAKMDQSFPGASEKAWMSPFTLWKSLLAPVPLQPSVMPLPQGHPGAEGRRMLLVQISGEQEDQLVEEGG